MPLIALILFHDNFGDRLRHNGWRQTYNLCKISSSIYIRPIHAAVARSLW